LTLYASHERPNRMRTEQEKLAWAVIQALVDDWMLVEEADEENLILVNESRTEMKGLRPSRLFVAWLENMGYIKNFGGAAGCRADLWRIHTYLSRRPNGGSSIA